MLDKKINPDKNKPDVNNFMLADALRVESSPGYLFERLSK